MPNLNIYLGQYKGTKIGSLIYYEIMIQLFLVLVSLNALTFWIIGFHMLFKEWAGEDDQSRNDFRVGTLKYKEPWFYVCS